MASHEDPVEVKKLSDVLSELHQSSNLIDLPRAVRSLVENCVSLIWGAASYPAAGLPVNITSSELNR